MLSLLLGAARVQACCPAPLCAAAAAGHGALRHASTASAASDAPAGEDPCLYDVVGVPKTASTEELKAAFRRRAKAVHPDAVAAAGGRPDRAAFVQLLAAYQVLSNPRTRQLYDVSRDPGSGPSVLRAAAAAAGAQPGGAYEEAEIDLSWGLGDMFKQPPPNSAAALDRVRQELQGELHSAMRRAYLGPRIEELDSGCLPDAFEADERAEADTIDLLQIVSGRQLLGAVRERRLELLARQQAAWAALQQQQEQRGQQGQAGTALPEGAAGQEAARPRQHHEQQQQQHASRQQVPQEAADCSTRAAGSPGQTDGQQQQPAQVQAAAGQQAAQSDSQSSQQHSKLPPGNQQQQQAGSQQLRQQRAQQRDPDILDLVIGEQLVASAIRQFPLPPSSSGASDASSSSRNSSIAGSSSSTVNANEVSAEQPSESGSTSGAHPHIAGEGEAAAGSSSSDGGAPAAAQAEAPPPLPAEMIAIYSSSGELLAQVESQQLDPGSSTASTARLLNAKGQHTHTVFRTQTPLVRHLTFAAELASASPHSRQPRRLVVCRARRAWLPPSSLWLFKPLSYSHDIGEPDQTELLAPTQTQITVWHRIARRLVPGVGWPRPALPPRLAAPRCADPHRRL